MDAVAGPALLADPPKRPAPSSRLVRALYTHNPFYVISADLVFIGLRMSFDPSAKAFDTWALIAGLAGFTLLLAVTACLLVRYGRVWDDMRSVLLLVVLMFLAISVTIDDVLILRPRVGLTLALGGWVFALGVSEALLRGMRLWLPALYRGPYYLILALFFVYPVALRPLLARPDAVGSHWALFGFGPAAGLVFLSLLPAIRRGGRYVKGNGSPWRWPLYPWTLFFFLGLGVCARSYYLCISLHNVEGYRSIFGPYFLVPFGFAVATLFLEAGLTSRREGVVRFSLLIPLGLLVLAMAGHRVDPVYDRFLGIFREGLGVAPPMATILVMLGFYGVAAFRQVPLARGLGLATLGALAVVGPATLGLATLTSPRPGPLLAVALIQGWLAFRSQSTWRAMSATACLVLALPGLLSDAWTWEQSVTATAHGGICAVLILGAVLRDGAGRLLRRFGFIVLGIMAIGFIMGDPILRVGLPRSLLPGYPFLVAGLSGAYALMLRDRFCLALAGNTLGLALLVVGSHWYLIVRQHVAGLDRIAVGLASFLVAMLISLGKAGAFRSRPRLNDFPSTDGANPPPLGTEG